MDPRGVKACSCVPGSTAEVMIFLEVTVDLVTTSPQGQQLQGNVPWI